MRGRSVGLWGVIYSRNNEREAFQTLTKRFDVEKNCSAACCRERTLLYETVRSKKGSEVITEMKFTVRRRLHRCRDGRRRRGRAVVSGPGGRRLSVAIAAVPTPEQSVGRVVEKRLRTGEFVLAGFAVFQQ